MRRFFLLPLLASTLLACGSDAAPTDSTSGIAVWSRRIGRASSPEPVQIAVAADGSVVAIGRFYGTVDFGAGPVSSPGNNFQVFVARYDASGAHVWSKSFGDFFGETTGGIDLDAAGNVYVAAGFGGTIDFGGGPLVSEGQDDFAVAKLDPAGNHVWSRRFGGAGFESLLSLDVGAAGDALIAGNFYGAFDFGGAQLSAEDEYRYFVGKLDSAGEAVWGRAIDPGYYGYKIAAALDPSGDAAVVGMFQESLDLGGDLHTNGDSDLFVAKLDAAGEPRWAKQFGSYSEDMAVDVAVNGKGHIFVTGTVSATVDFGGGPLGTADDSDPYLLELDGAGGHVKSRRFEGDSYEYATSIAADDEGNAVVTGAFYSFIDLGAGVLQGVGENDAFVVKVASSGETLWGRAFGSTRGEEGGSVALGEGGRVAIAGTGMGDYDLGDGVKPGSGYYDFFVGVLAP